MTNEVTVKKQGGIKTVKIEHSVKDKWKNKKTGNIYFKIDEVRDTTNAREGNIIVLYLNPSTLEIYGRDLAEFLEKFERLGV